MNNSDNNKATTNSSSTKFADFIEHTIRYLGLLLYSGLVFWSSFGLLHIFFDEFAATLLAVLVVYLIYDREVRTKMMSS